MRIESLLKPCFKKSVRKLILIYWTKRVVPDQLGWRCVWRDRIMSTLESKVQGKGAESKLNQKGERIFFLNLNLIRVPSRTPTGISSGLCSVGCLSLSHRRHTHDRGPFLSKIGSIAGWFSTLLSIHFSFISKNWTSKEWGSIVAAQAVVEERIEAALVHDGFDPETIMAKRHQVRGFLFYPSGTSFAEQTYVDYVKSIDNRGTRACVPYKRVIQAIRQQNFSLEREDWKERYMILW